ncbi:PepSY domain-containing protein [Massilia atriviolacea]|uniref:PepSY domain-containing protein n=2 Tax=Massilia atriviolacea TaxID=2495579 RepID=A0A430HCN1_9BURK|nr:PepSY domain-containing protein [Massilia atriviolacea]
MAWLHTWCGLWFSWLLYAVFLTGTLAVFDEPITHWMSPEHALEEHAAAPAVPVPLSERRQRLALGAAFMAQAHPRADMWEIWPINRNDNNALTAYWFNRQGGYAEAKLDPASGAPVAASAAHKPVRPTLGGHHFVDFHYELHAGKVGLWITAIAAMAMLVALVSGIVTHKRIFKDFFTFRPAKGQRSWLDAHNAMAVLTLPFLIMIAYTGLAISSVTLMPAPLLARYGPGVDNMKQFLADLGGPAKLARSGDALAVPDLERYAARAEALFRQPVRCIVIDNPGDSSMRIGVYGWDDEADSMTRIANTTGMVLFSAASGEVLAVRQGGQVDGGAASLTRLVMGSLHMASFGGLAIRWLYFVCGLAGTAMMATGAILFMVKRRNKHGAEFGAATARVYRLVEGLNVAAIAGLAVACMAFLWANRLLPLDLEQRAGWELRVFFGAWVAALAHGLLRAPAAAWREQLGALAGLCLLLPLLNWMTTGDHLVAQIAGRADWESAGVELAALLAGALAAWAALKTGRRTA